MSTDKKDITKIVNGVTVYWTAEGAPATKTKPGFGVIELIANKLTALVSGTNELIDDNQSNEEVFNLMRDLIGEAMAAFEDDQVMNGDGTGKNFLGIFSDTNVPTVTARTGTSFSDLEYKDLVNTKNAVPMKYRKRSGAKLAWAMSQDSYTAIEGLQDANGKPLVRESIVNGTDIQTLLGYPIEVVESAPATDGANKPVLVFGDFSAYLIGDRKTLSFEFGYAQGDWESDIQSLKASERIAGKMAFADAFTILKTHA
jgi:HK97 family phage major capsid protein